MDASVPLRSVEHDQLSERFETEPEDHARSEELNRYFTDALNDLDLEGSIDELKCGTTLCRVNVHFADLDQALRFQAQAGMPELRKSIDVQMVDGQLDVEVFLARD